MSSLKKTLVLPVLDREVSVDVDFRVIEIVERIFDMSADAVITVFADSRRIQRNKVADVIVSWLTFTEVGAKRREIREAIMRSSPELLGIYVNSIYAALLFSLNYFDQDDPKKNGEKFDELIASPEFPKLRRDGEGSKKKTTSTKARSSASASTSESGS